MRLFHFSDDPHIAVFEPRPVLIPAERSAGREWLNGALVWAIDEWHQPMYLFPRECPRILLWPTRRTSEEDRAIWFGERSCRMRAFIERAWLDRVATGSLWRYEFGDETFEDIGDAGMWVSRAAAIPRTVEKIEDLRARLEAEDVELDVVESLLPLRDVWKTSLHASGIRLRNASGWVNSSP